MYLSYRVQIDDIFSAYHSPLMSFSTHESCDLPLPRVFMSRMPGRGKSGPHKVRHLKAKQQKKRFIRSKDPILSVFMWGVQHSVSNCYCRHGCFELN